MSRIIQLPNNGWKPRQYQRKLWSYLENGGRHAEALWHRRAGKDEILLHWGAVASHQRVATYWHMLPMASQARKAIWEAINPHTGKRRIDEAFPMELRETTRENEMLIKLKVGSTWQVVGSDNFNSLVGSPPAGVVCSEWALANPAARAYLRPILAENGGWQAYITTPRGKNHAYQTFMSAQSDPRAFAEKLTVFDTGALSVEDIERERKAYQDDYGLEAGDALFRQEYLCDFDAAILGAYYGSEMRQALEQGRIASIDHDPDLAVHTAWDLGWTDDTAVWFFQVHRGEVRVIDYFSVSGADIPTIAERILSKPYRYGDHWLPHDARPKTLAANGRSIVEQLFALGIRGRIVPSLSLQDGIQAARMMFPRVWIDETRCDDGIECLRQYQREYDADKRIFRDKPLHNWTSHGADAFRYMAIAYREMKPEPRKEKPRFLNDMTANELFWPKTDSPVTYERI
jgi:phage terminase large subunit